VARGHGHTHGRSRLPASSASSETRSLPRCGCAAAGGSTARRVADGNHARIDGFVSLGVVPSSALVAIGLERGDPLVGLAITLVILKITWDSWRTIRHGLHEHEHEH
jgi:hypothetical protein